MTNGFSTGLAVLKRRTLSGRMGAWALSAFFLACAPSPALAAVIGLVIPNNTGPAVQTVGQTNLPASLTLTNANTGAEAGQTNVVTNITLIPSCAVPGTPGCATANPGVYQASATGIGAAGSACGGEIFNISVVNASTGQLLFTPTSLAVVLLAPTVNVAQSSCTIVFSLDVLNVPIDVDPGVAEAQTFSTASATFTSETLVVFTANGQSSTRTINRATPTIATVASPGIALGAGTLTDSATVGGRVSPLAGATVTFNLYGPNNATCTGAPVFTSSVSYPVAGGSVSSAAFTPTTAGTYRWIASYSGDANNAPVTGACNDANESTIVNRATPTIVTNATASIVLGTGSISDTATVSGRVNPQAGATVTFSLYGPNDATCSASPVFTSSAVSYPVAGGSVSSGTFTPTAAGTYRWIASYSGDANNAPVTGACNDANETSTVTAPVTTFSGSSPTGTGTVSATLSGGGAGCGFTSTALSAAANPPPGVSFPHGLFGFTAATCTGSISVTVTYPQAIPAGAQYYKFGPEPSNLTPHYYTIPASISGNQVTFSITDGGVGDSDGAANGSITDPGGIGLVDLTGGVQGIPTLGEWALLMLMLAMASLAGLRLRRRG